MDIYSFFFCSDIQKSADPGYFSVLLAYNSRQIVYMEINLPTMYKINRNPGHTRHLFSIWKIGELCKLFCGQIPPFYAENGYWERIFFYMSKHWPRGQPVPAAPGNLRQLHRARRGNLCPPDWHLRPGRRLLAPQTAGIFTCFPRSQRNSILNN